MRYWILGLTLLLTVTCNNKNNDTTLATNDGSPSYDLESAKGLCFYVMDQADKATGEKAVQKIVTEGYRKATCPELTDQQLPLWRCMKEQIDLGVGFAAMDEYCSDKF